MSAKKTEAPKQETPKAAPSLTPVTKITVKTVFGKIEADAVPEKGELKVCRIAGFASGIKSGQSTYGEWAALTGEFAATNYETGEVFASRTAIVPGAMGEMLLTATEAALAEDASAKVRFSVDVSVKRSERDAAKYEYVVRPVIESGLSSPALALLEM